MGNGRAEKFEGLMEEKKKEISVKEINSYLLCMEKDRSPALISLQQVNGDLESFSMAQLRVST